MLTVPSQYVHGTLTCRATTPCGYLSAALHTTAHAEVMGCHMRMDIHASKDRVTTQN